MINIVTIDPSISSTAVNINGKYYNYVKESYALTKNGLSKWYKICEDIINYRYTKPTTFKSYSEGELTKLNDYNHITDLIITDIINNIDKSIPTIIGIEGYSYSSASGKLIDLVTFSTLLRNKLYNEISKLMVVFSPSTLKLLSCKMTYTPIQIGKKLEYRNNEGVSGGKFNKIDIYKSIIENDSYNCTWVKILREYKDELLCMKDLKKPFDDINDSYNIFNIISYYLNEYDIDSEITYDNFIKKLQLL